MRIGILLTGLDGGGAQRRLLTLAGEFVRRGHGVSLLVGSPRGRFAGLVPDGALVVPLRAARRAVAGVERRKSLRMLVGLPALAGVLRRDPPDVLLGSSTPANLAGLLARKLAASRVPIVISINMPISRSTTEKGRPAAARLVRRLYPQCDAAIALARSVADDAIGFAGMSRDLVTVIPSPVAVSRIAALARETPSHAWLSRGPSPAGSRNDGEPVLLAVGKLKSQKDYPTLLRALQELRRRRPARLVVLGAGEQLPRLTSLAADLGVAEAVRFAGFDDNPFASMARADLFVSASRWEGFSNAIAEALACGCPVVATDCPGGVREFLDDGRYGRLVPVGDPRALAAAIDDALDQRPDRGGLRRRAAEFDVARVAEAYLAVLQRAVA